MKSRFPIATPFVLLGLIATPLRAEYTDKPVVALVAASTQDAVTEIAAAFTKETKIAVKISGAASNTLANQILHGAPADVFLSASQEWADAVDKKGLSAKTIPLLSNRLTLIVAKGNPLDIKQPADLMAAKVTRVVLPGEKIPLGAYAKQALDAAHVYDDLIGAKKIVRAQDARATLAFVERGEAPASIGYSSDARLSKAVEAAYTFDEKSHDAIRYPLVLVKREAMNPAASRWFDYLESESAAKIFEKYGFQMVKR